MALNLSQALEGAIQAAHAHKAPPSWLEQAKAALASGDDREMGKAVTEIAAAYGNETAEGKPWLVALRQTIVYLKGTSAGYCDHCDEWHVPGVPRSTKPDCLN